jgi:RNA-binding protein
MAITKDEKKILKGKSHHLKPIAIAGKEGLSEAFVASVKDAITARELIKVKFLEASGLDKKEASTKLAEILGAEVVDVIGFSISLYKFNENAKKHVLEIE